MKSFFDWLTEGGRVVKLLYALCAVALVLEVIFRLVGESYGHPHFAYETWFGFHAGWGFVTFALLVACAHALGALTRRDEDYYDEPDSLPGEDGEEEDDARAAH